MDLSPSDKYEIYLDALTEVVLRLDSDLRNFEALWTSLDRYSEVIDEAPGTFIAFLNGLRTSTLLGAYRLYDTDAKSASLRTLVRFALKNHDSMTWQGDPLSKKQLEEHKNRIKGQNDRLDRMRMHRNKVYAHLDSDTILNWQQFHDDYPVFLEDIREAVNLAQEVLSEHHLARNNVSLKMTISASEDVEHLLQLAEEGLSCRKVKRKNAI